MEFPTLDTEEFWIRSRPVSNYSAVNIPHTLKDKNYVPEQWAGVCAIACGCVYGHETKCCYKQKLQVVVMTAIC